MPKFLTLTGTQFKAMFLQWREDRRRLKRLKKERKAHGRTKIVPYW